MKKLYLVDVSSMYFRAFYAIRNLSNSKGLPTNALYGFLTMSLKLLKDIKPDYIAYCLDRKEPGFRVQLDPRYKANRSEMPEDLQKQMPYIPKIIEALGVPAFDKEGFEADDIIGTICDFAEKNQIEVVIVSGDKDFGQLVSPLVTLYDPMKEVRLDSQGVRAKMGVDPEQVVDYLAIVGDTSDNVPGVKGIGEKGAQKLLSKFRTLDEVYEHVNEITPESMKTKLIVSKDEAYLSKKLVTIVRDVPIKFSIDDLKIKPFDKSNLRTLLQELEFKTLEKSLFSEAVETPAIEVNSAVEKDSSSEVIMSEEELTCEQLDQILKPNESVWALWANAGFALGVKDKIYHIQGSVEDLSKVFNSKQVSWSGFDLKSFWKNFNVLNPQAEWDHKLAAYIVSPKEHTSLDELYELYAGKKLPEIPSHKQIYQAHLDLKKILNSELSRVGGLQILNEIEIPLVSILYQMEKIGISLNTDLLREQSLQLGIDIKVLEREIYKEVGEEFNISSPKQLSHILFEKMKMPPGRKTKTGLSTDSDVLEKLSLQYPVCKQIIEYRELSKLRSTYVDALPLLVDPNDKRLHTTFNQAVTATGRLSSTNPNLQNIPIRTERGAAIRKAFVAADGYSLISADYSQIELRILAHITEDPNLVKAFEDDLDIHSATAVEIFSVPLDQVTPDLRRTAKAVNFGIAYGMEAYGLSENLNIDFSEANQIIKRYFQRFSKVKDYMVSIVEDAKKNGYVETIMGRKRYLPELQSKNNNIRKFGERAAINAPIQGTASDIVKKSMVDIGFDRECPMLLQVHDELIFECKKGSEEDRLKFIKSKMENVTKLKVPLKVQIRSGNSWSEAH